MIARHLHHPATNRLVMLASVTVVVVVAYSISFASMWELWQTSDHRHGILVFPIVAFLIWRQRHEIEHLPVRASVPGLLLVVPVAMAWVIARLAGVQVVEHVAVLALIPATVLALVGPRITRKLWFPLLFLLLATPVGDALIPYLMVITADISTGLLRLSGVPVLREGQYLSLPGGNFVVADVCAGARYLTSGIMIALLYGHLTYSRISKTALLVLTTAVTLVITNGVRAYIVMAIASATNLEYFGGRDHVYFGWLLFGIVMMLILWTAQRYADEEMLSGPANRSRATNTHASHTAIPIIMALGLIMLATTVNPLQADFGETGSMLAAAAALLAFIYLLSRQHQAPASEADMASSEKQRMRFGNIFAGIAAVIVLIATPRFVAGLENTAIQPVDAHAFTPAIDCLPAGQWQNSWQPSFHQPEVEHAVAFECAGNRVQVYMAAYGSTHQGSELISSSNSVVPTEWDRNVESGDISIDDAEGNEFDLVEIVVARSQYKGMIWYWYDVDGMITASPLKTKILQVLALLQSRPAGGRVTVIETAITDDDADARERLELAARELMAL